MLIFTQTEGDRNLISFISTKHLEIEIDQKIVVQKKIYVKKKIYLSGDDDSTVNKKKNTVCYTEPSEKALLETDLKRAGTLRKIFGRLLDNHLSING